MSLVGRKFVPLTACHESGAMLIEVMIALSLLAIVLVSLGGTASALLSGVARLDWAPSDRGDGPASDVWTWGPRPGLVEWLPGPRLQVRLQGAGTQGAELLGVWVDGWLECEVPTRDRMLTIGDPGLWSVRRGSEVVVRARRHDGPWGSPLRVLVPSPNGSIEVATGSTISIGLLAIHMPAVGMASLTVNTAVPTQITAVGTPTSVALGAGGVAEVIGAGAAQQVLVEDGTSVDVYQ